MDNLVCEVCSEAKDDVIETICPYSQDVHNEEVAVTICTDCYNERCMDI